VSEEQRQRPAGNNGHPKSGFRRFLFRYLLPVGLPAVGAIMSAVAAATKGAPKGYWILGVVAATIGSALLSVLKDRNATSAQERAVLARAELATAITVAGQPLVTALGNVSSGKDPQSVQTSITVLLDRVVAIAQTRAGREASSRCNTRAAFYRFDEDGNLQRVAYEGRPGGPSPRRSFVAGRSEHDDAVLRFAKSEEALLVSDLEESPPPHFLDRTGRSYKCFISVPVRTVEKSYGLLTVDSDVPNTLSGVDRGYMILLAGALASGLAHEQTIAAIAGQRA
jgi:putative methionine-R-sulfoxide reductase with GAF domain